MTSPSLVLTAAVSTLLLLAHSTSAQPKPLLAQVFQSHAVLQRDRPISVWGDAAPGERVTVTLGERRVEATADAAGRWRTELPAMPAGGPYTLVAAARSGSTQSIDDILLGDVWLCSGQSNMEMPVAQTLNAEGEIEQSADASIRLLTVAHADSPAPLDRFRHPVAWQPASPDTVKDFSATCFYFAREIRKTVKVPMGLIDSSWGGSNIEAWIGAEGLTRVGGFDQRLDVLRTYAEDPGAGIAQLGRTWAEWWRTRVAAAEWGEPWRPESDTGWDEVPAAMGNWKTWGVEALARHDGMVWFRRRFTLTAAQAAQAATLSLGPIDEVDQTWVNGEPSGNTFGWGTPRSYELPAGRLREGDNFLVVNVYSAWDKGGMFGPAEVQSLRFADGSALPLGGSWRYRAVPASAGAPPRGPWHAIGGLTTLSNAMIAPIGPYALRGILWYQGETNAGSPEGYDRLLGALMRDWRARFGEGLPVLVVQLPNFGPAPTVPTDSGWARLREAQRRAVAADPHAGMAVTIDIGDRLDVHPPNKQEVGRRLARAARRLVYGEHVTTAAGPVPQSVRRDGTRVVVTFGDIDGRLVAYSAAQPIGFELCGADQASCRFATATIDGASVALDAGSEGAGATRVRYCWGAGPICTLYDESGLPAGPFELTIDAAR